MGPGCFFGWVLIWGDLEVHKRKERCRRSHDSAPVFCVPGHLAYPLRPSRGLQRPPLARAPVTSLVGAAPVLPAPRHTHARAHTHLRKGETEARQKEDPRQGHVGRGRGVRLRFCAPLDPAPRRPDA